VSPHVEAGGEPFADANRIIGRSWIATTASGVLTALTAAVETSRSRMLARRARCAWSALLPRERAGAVVLTVLTALAGHVWLARWLPAAAHPEIPLTTLVLTALFLAAIAAATGQTRKL
jgi:hypothetical protein